MRLIFGTSDDMNTTISDEHGRRLYKIAMASIATTSKPKRITTITKYRWSGPGCAPETMGAIEWHKLKQTLFRFNGDVIEADTMLQKRRWHTGRYFLGPDRRSYKWKLESTHCWLKPAESNIELARFHKKNLGIRKQAHPPYLDVASKAIPMLDHVILTFIYVESLRQERQGPGMGGGIDFNTGTSKRPSLSMN